MLEKFELTRDPFPIVPDGPVHNWAGHDELKEDLIDLVKGVRARDIGVTEFVIMHGELGAGKSHALRYLKTLIGEDTDHFNSLAIYVDQPRVATKLNFLELQRFIIKEIGRDNLQDACQRLKSIFDGIADERSAAADMADASDKSSFFTSAIDEVSAGNRDMIRLLIRGAENIEPVFDFLTGVRVCDGDEYDGKVDSDYLASRMLGQLFRVLTDRYHGDNFVFESVYLFVDEAEVLVESKASEADLLFSGFRELINEVPYRFCLILSFSVATALIEAVMPNHLLKRMTRTYVEVSILSDEQAIDFLKSQISCFRTEGSKQKNPFYPFEKAAIEYVVEQVTESTPRNLFIQCKRVLERSIRRNELQPGEEITKDMAEEILGAYS